jgi:GntR family transcriptional regulator
MPASPQRRSPLPARDPAVGPLYREAKRHIIAAIESGRHAPGEALPSEGVLASSLGVSIGTLRHAVDELVAEHVVIRRQGKGTFVAQHSPQRFLFQYFHVEHSDGQRELPEVHTLNFERLRCPADAAAALRLGAGDAVFLITNRLLLRGRAVVLDRLVLSASLFKGLTEKRWRERGSTIYQLYQNSFGITVLQVHERANAVLADRSAARGLGVAMGAPLLQVRRTATTFGDRPVEYRVSLIDTRHHDYVRSLGPPEPR